MDAHHIEEAVKEKYGRAAKAATDGEAAACCSSSCCASGDPITSHLYSDAETKSLPKEAVSASLGCGNPTALIDLHAGDVVLDLGSGGGIDVLLSASAWVPRQGVWTRHDGRNAGPRAREPTQGGRDKRRVPQGRIDAIPLPDHSVDVVISNCVINLSPTRTGVSGSVPRFEAWRTFRGLRCGGRGKFPPVCADMELWMGCIAGALEDTH